jgi:hypothetical protein
MQTMDMVTMTEDMVVVAVVRGEKVHTDTYIFYTLFIYCYCVLFQSLIRTLVITFVLI